MPDQQPTIANAPRTRSIAAQEVYNSDATLSDKRAALDCDEASWLRAVFGSSKPIAILDGRAVFHCYAVNGVDQGTVDLGLALELRLLLNAAADMPVEQWPSVVGKTVQFRDGDAFNLIPENRELVLRAPGEAEDMTESIVRLQIMVDQLGAHYAREAGHER